MKGSWEAESAEWRKGYQAGLSQGVRELNELRAALATCKRDAMERAAKIADANANLKIAAGIRALINGTDA